MQHPWHPKLTSRQTADNREASRRRRDAIRHPYKQTPEQIKNNNNDGSGSMTNFMWHQAYDLADLCKSLVHKHHKVFDDCCTHEQWEKMTDAHNKAHPDDKRNIHTLREEPLLPKDFRHQIMRKVLHIHKKLQEMLCTHYMKSFYAKNYNEPQCLEVLRHIVLRELQDNDNIMNKQDKAFLDLILSNQMVAQAIHKWLSQLGEDVCLIKWCCEWINERNIWTDEHAPLGAMVKTNEVGQLPTYFTLDKKTYIHPHTHFTNEMCRMYTHLRPNDLVQIIKMRWRTDLNQINGMVYRGKSVHVNFYTARDQWMNLVRAGFERFQDDWIRKHPHVQYNYTLGTSVLPFFSLSGQENGVCSNCGMSGHGARNCAEERIKREDNGYGEEVFPPYFEGGWLGGVWYDPALWEGDSDFGSLNGDDDDEREKEEEDERIRQEWMENHYGEQQA